MTPMHISACLSFLFFVSLFCYLKVQEIDWQFYIGIGTELIFLLSLTSFPPRFIEYQKMHMYPATVQLSPSFRALNFDYFY